MNKYQSYIVDELNFFYYQENDSSIRNNPYRDSILIIKQNDDITITKYILNLNSGTVIASVEYYKNKKWTTANINNFYYSYNNKTNSIEVYSIPIDFDDRVNKIKITFINNIVDPIVLPIEYVEADKEAYYAKKESERKEALLKAASITHEVGTDLVNIFFQPCSVDYHHTEIDLYYQDRLLANYKVNQGEFFKSIDKLASCTFYYILRQYNAKNEIIIETKKIEFTITNNVHYVNSKPIITPH